MFKGFNSTVLRFGDRWLAVVFFPLTPALSLGERENGLLIQKLVVALPTVLSVSVFLPLTKREGWGEGEGRLRMFVLFRGARSGGILAGQDRCRFCGGWLTHRPAIIW